jgi:hypothetical protein
MDDDDVFQAPLVCERVPFQPRKINKQTERASTYTCGWKKQKTKNKQAARDI